MPAGVSRQRPTRNVPVRPTPARSNTRKPPKSRCDVAAPYCTAATAHRGGCRGRIIDTQNNRTARRTMRRHGQPGNFPWKPEFVNIPQLSEPRGGANAPCAHPFRKNRIADAPIGAIVYLRERGLWRDGRNKDPRRAREHTDPPRGVGRVHGFRR